MFINVCIVRDHSTSHTYQHTTFIYINACIFINVRMFINVCIVRDHSTSHTNQHTTFIHINACIFINVCTQDVILSPHTVRCILIQNESDAFWFKSACAFVSCADAIVWGVDCALFEWFLRCDEYDATHFVWDRLSIFVWDRLPKCESKSWFCWSVFSFRFEMIFNEQLSKCESFLFVRYAFFCWMLLSCKASPTYLSTFLQHELVTLFTFSFERSDCDLINDVLHDWINFIGSNNSQAASVFPSRFRNNGFHSLGNGCWQQHGWIFVTGHCKGWRLHGCNRKDGFPIQEIRWARSCSSSTGFICLFFMKFDRLLNVDSFVVQMECRLLFFVVQMEFQTSIRPHLLGRTG